MFPILKNQKGQVAVLIVFLFIILLGFVGLSIDVWHIVYTKQSLQNSIDLTALAAAQELTTSHGQVVSTSIAFGEKNGIYSDELIINHPYNGDNNKVELVVTKNVSLVFFPLFGMHTKEVSVRAVAEAAKETTRVYSYEPFDYAIFHGNSDALQIKGNGSVVNGNIHSNGSISVSGNKHTFNGDVTACTTIDSGRTTITGTVSPNSPNVPIPALDFNEYSKLAVQVFDSDLTLNGDVNIEGVWLVNGNCHISGARVSGKGILLATGEIQISGSLDYVTRPIAVLSQTTGTITYLSLGDLLAMYSLTNIRISATGVNIEGVLYAPNGELRIDGSNNTFNGALIAKQVVWATSDITINGSYDLRVPQAFDMETDILRLIE